MGKMYIIAGPCSAESEQQVLTCAQAVKDAGCDVFRAGLWKPRTSPSSFAGVGAEGLPWLERVQKEIGINAATEIATAEHLNLCLEHNITHLWIGARTTANPFMVQQIADAAEQSGRTTELTMMVKNPMHPDIEAWIGAIQRLQKAGVEKIIAIHRGFSDTISSTATTCSMRNDPLWSLVMSLKRRLPNIPLICDPSHLTGNSELVLELSQQAVNLGMEGLMIEVHPNPQNALSDAKQQIDLEQLRTLLNSLVIPHSHTNDIALQALRHEIDRIDNTIWNLILERLETAEQIGHIKHKAGMPVYQNDRYSTLLATRLKWAEENGLDQQAVKQIVEALHELAIAKQI